MYSREDYNRVARSYRDLRIILVDVHGQASA